MRFTDLFIERPVLATVVNVLILLIGARAFTELPVAEYPELTVALITVTTPYVGADPELVRGFVTVPLEQAIAQADGIDFIRSSSIRGLSEIEVQLRLNYDVNDAVTQITSKIDEIRNDLPRDSETPSVEVTIGDESAAMYMSFESDILTRSQVTEYILRVARPRFSTIAGVQEAELLGARTYAMRVWLDPTQMNALDVTAGDVRQALERNNYLSAAGSTRGRSEAFSISANTSLESVEEFRRLVVRERDSVPVLLSDVATIELGSEFYNQDVRASGTPTVFIAIELAPGANLLSTLAEVRSGLEDLQTSMPAGLRASINLDTSIYVRDAINEVSWTLAEAVAIVVVVIFLFLGSLRATIIPALAVPLSLVGVGTIMLILGFSINLLTLLAMVLAIGLVVDDAIIVVENIHRHVEGGLRPHAAAIKGARELAGPVIAMTLTLLAVYAPIGFLGGVTGTLFYEFAFALAGSVLISGIVALTLSPVMAAKLLPRHSQEGRFTLWLEELFERLKNRYQRLLHRMLDFRVWVTLLAGMMLMSCYWLYQQIPTELAPNEDKSLLVYRVQASTNTSLDQMTQYSSGWIESISELPEVQANFHFSGGDRGLSHSAFGGVQLVPPSQRDKSATGVLSDMQALGNISTGLQVGVYSRPPLPGGGYGLPVEFIITSADSAEQVYAVAQEMIARAWGSGLFAYVTTDLFFDNAQFDIDIDREKAIDLGLDMESIGRDLAVYLGEGYVNRFSLAGRAYKVIPQVKRDYRLYPEQILDLPIRTDSGVMLPLSSVAQLDRRVEPRELLTFQQQNSAAISAIPLPGVGLGEAIGFLEQQAEELFPLGYAADYAGQSRIFKSEQGTLALTFAFALIIIFLVLAAQFESFRDPTIMLVTVPLSISGALAFMAMGYATMNIYSQVGLVTLIGLISKHGILIVQFANQLRDEEGLDRRAAVEAACAIRLRPILMTTAAIVLAVMPLIFAEGAGAASRQAIGVVIASGMAIGTLFTLFIVPAIYTYLAHPTSRAQSDSAEIEAQTTVAAPR